MTDHLVVDDHTDEVVGDILAHHGVKGMKWGVRKDKPSSSDIANARANQNVRSLQVNQAFVKSVTSRNPGERAKAKKEYKKLNEVFLNHPDRVTALRLTKGEKVVLGLIAVGIPGPGTVGAGAYGAANVAGRKAVERAQNKRKAASS